MCKDTNPQTRSLQGESYSNVAKQTAYEGYQGSPLIRQLENQREYHLRKLMDVQKALDAVQTAQS